MSLKTSPLALHAFEESGSECRRCHRFAPPMSLFSSWYASNLEENCRVTKKVVAVNWSSDPRANWTPLSTGLGATCTSGVLKHLLVTNRGDRFLRESMASALILVPCRRKITQELSRPQSRHYAAVCKPYILGKGVQNPSSCITSRIWNSSSRSGFLRESSKGIRTQVSHPESFQKTGFTNAVRGVETKRSHSYAERVLLGLSQVGQQTLAEIRQVLRLSVDSVAAARADVQSQGHLAWQLLGERGYLHTWEKVTFPQLGKVLRAASLVCVRYQVVPRTLAVAVGNATFVRQSAAESNPLSALNGLYEEGLPRPVFLIGLIVTLLEGFILIFRAAYLGVLFTPALVMAPFVNFFGEEYRETWLRLVHHTLELAGAAFIKWGQWAATRPDLFPKDLCEHLSKLHSKAPAHSFDQTRRTVEGAFRRKLDEIFEDFEEEPVASGSIAQVHRAVLRYRHPGQKSKPLTVAVKVRHPGVSEVIRRDFAIINWVAKISTYLPGISWLRLDESVQQFAVFMLTQVDLAREAAHLSRFIYNFRRWKNVSFPKPLYPLVHPEVLVETFEDGESVATYVEKAEKSKVNRGLAHIGTHTLLKMLLVDNFVHADLHPGNILVRVNSPGKRLFRSNPHVVLLDVGMTVELSQRDRSTLLNFFKAIASKNGRLAAEYTLQFSQAQSCPDPEAFKDAVDTVCKFWYSEDGDSLHAGDCIQDLLEQVRLHRVNIDGDVCTVMVTTLVLEGWQRKLDPDLDIMDTLHSLLFKSDWASSLTYTIDGLMGP